MLHIINISYISPIFHLPSMYQQHSIGSVERKSDIEHHHSLEMKVTEEAERNPASGPAEKMKG